MMMMMTMTGDGDRDGDNHNAGCCRNILGRTDFIEEDDDALQPDEGGRPRSSQVCGQSLCDSV